jgi:hypothetical protein
MKKFSHKNEGFQVSDQNIDISIPCSWHNYLFLCKNEFKFLFMFMLTFTHRAFLKDWDWHIKGRVCKVFEMEIQENIFVF